MISSRLRDELDEAMTPAMGDTGDCDFLREAYSFEARYDGARREAPALLLNSIGRDGRAERDAREFEIGLAVVAVVALRRSLFRFPVPSLSLLSDVEQKTESITSGVLAPVDFDSFSPAGRARDDLGVELNRGVVFVLVW
jgi:hypothetical protein